MRVRVRVRVRARVRARARGRGRVRVRVRGRVRARVRGRVRVSRCQTRNSEAPAAPPAGHFEDYEAYECHYHLDFGVAKIFWRPA